MRKNKNKYYTVAVGKDTAQASAITGSPNMVVGLNATRYPGDEFSNREISLNSFNDPRFSYPPSEDLLHGSMARAGYNGSHSTGENLNGEYVLSRNAFREMFLQKIRDEAGSKPVVISTYSSTKVSDDFINMGFERTGPKSELFYKYKVKTDPYNLAESLDIPVGEGSVVYNMEEAVRLFPKLKDKYGSVFVSSENGSAGESALQVTDLGELVNFPDNPPFVMTGWVNKLASPTSMVLIGKENSIYLGLADQLIEGVKYGGTIYPSVVDQRLQNQIMDSTLRISDVMRKDGYRGIANMDWIISEERPDEALFTEINPRRNGSSGIWLGNLNRYLPEDHPSIYDLEIIASVENKDWPSNMTDLSKITDNRSHFWGMKLVKAKGKGMIVEETDSNYSENSIFNGINGHSRRSIVGTLPSGTLLPGYRKAHRIGRVIAVAPDRDTVIKELEEGTKEANRSYEIIT